MGDISEQHNPLASANTQDAQSSSDPANEHSRSEADAPLSRGDDSSGEGTNVSRMATPEQLYTPGSASLPAYVEQAVIGETSQPFLHRRYSTPSIPPMQEATPYAQPSELLASIILADNLSGTSEDHIKLDKGKERAGAQSEQIETSRPASLPEYEQDRLAKLGMVLTSPSGTWTIPPAHLSDGTHQSLQSRKQIYSISEGPDDYPHIHAPRFISRRGALPYQPRQKLPQPRGMHSHRHVTSYAGEPLFRLCSSVPYILGSLTLVTRLQLIVETPILLPDEAKNLLAAGDVDITSLESYDMAMLTILCCLWNDWEPSPYQRSQWLVAGLATQRAEEPTHTDHRLELYFLRRHAIVHRRYCNVLEYMAHMNRWSELPNPARVLDYDEDELTWRQIVSRLGESEVDFRKLDGDLYDRLRSCESDDVLTSKIFEIKFLQNSGALEQRYTRWKGLGGDILDSQLRDETNRRYPMSLNNKRFSHRHPLGVDAFEYEIEQTEQTSDANARTLDGIEKYQRQLAQLVKPRNWWRACASKAWHIVKRYWNYPAWRYIVFPTLVFVPMLGGLVYMWLQEGGCGERCLDQVLK